MRLTYLFITFFVLLGFGRDANGQSQQKKSIDNFKLVSQEKVLKIIATDEDNTATDEKIVGSYPFSMNGLDVPLKFSRGEAVVKQNFSGSTFVYFHPEANSLASVRLYYLLKTGETYWPIKIPIALLLIIPIAFFIIGYFVKKLIFLFIGIILAFFLFNTGLSVGSYFEVLGSWVQGLF